MKPPQDDAHRRAVAGLGRMLGFSLGAVLILATPAHPQNRPPLQEPIALEGSMKQFYRAANVVVVTTMDGVEHVYQFTKDLIVHGGKKPGIDALEGLREGTTVVVHESIGKSQPAADEIDIVGDEGLKSTEGMVTNIDHRKGEITIRYNNGKTETLQMTTRAAAETEAGAAGTGEEASTIIVYYSDEGGRKIAHYFKRGS